MKKLKSQYRHSLTKMMIFRTTTNVREIYPSVRSHYHKHFSTKQEKSYYFLHKIENRGYPIKFRAARGRTLADPWDDYPSSVYRVAKSWKHNSSRHKQYYK
jgi:hypothetical protein